MHIIHAHTLDQDRALRDRASEGMKSCLAKMHTEGIEAYSLIKTGEPEAEILHEIETGQYDQVAMAMAPTLSAISSLAESLVA